MIQPAQHTLRPLYKGSCRGIVDLLGPRKEFLIGHLKQPLSFQNFLPLPAPQNATSVAPQMRGNRIVRRRKIWNTWGLTPSILFPVHLISMRLTPLVHVVLPAARYRDI